MLALAISLIRFLQEIENQIVNLRRDICDDSLVVFFVADLRRKDFDFQPQIIRSVQTNNQIGLPNLVAKVQDAGEKLMLSAGACNFIPNVQIVMPELRFVSVCRFDDDFVPLLFVEHRRNRIDTNTTTGPVYHGTGSFRFSQLTLKSVIANHLQAGISLMVFDTLKPGVRCRAFDCQADFFCLDVNQLIRASRK